VCALIAAAWSGRGEVVECLLDEDGFTALLVAAGVVTERRSSACSIEGHRLRHRTGVA
jgi:hypothetical protein